MELKFVQYIFPESGFSILVWLLFGSSPALLYQTALQGLVVVMPWQNQVEDRCSQIVQSHKSPNFRRSLFGRTHKTITVTSVIFLGEFGWKLLQLQYTSRSIQPAYDILLRNNSACHCYQCVPLTWPPCSLYIIDKSRAVEITQLYSITWSLKKALI